MRVLLPEFTTCGFRPQAWGRDPGEWKWRCLTRGDEDSGRSVDSIFRSRARHRFRLHRLPSIYGHPKWVRGLVFDTESATPATPDSLPLHG